MREVQGGKHHGGLIVRTSEAMVDDVLAIARSGLSQQSLLGRTLDLLPTGIVLLDTDRTVTYVNRCAREVASAGDVLTFQEGGECRALDPAEDAQLQRLLKFGVPARTAPGVPLPVLTLAGPGAARRVVVMASVFRGEAGRKEASGIALLLERCAPVSPGLAGTLPQLYGLTESEAKLAVALARGITLRDYAATSGIKVTTAKTHLQRALQKTGTRRQIELVQLLGRIPDVTRPGAPA